MHFSIRINAQPNYGQPNYGYANYGYPNTYPERAYYPSGPVNPEHAMAQNLGRELAYGDSQGAANMLRSELYCNPRNALRLVNEANRDAGPYARDRINQLPDGSLVIQDNYTGAMTAVNGRSPYGGFPPPRQVPGYYANANENFYSGGNPNPGVYNPGTYNPGVYNPSLAAWNTPAVPPISFAFYGGNRGYGHRGNYVGINAGLYAANYYPQYSRYYQPGALGFSIRV